MKMMISGQFTSLDKMVLGLENFPCGLLYRAVFGWFLMPVYLRLFGERASQWMLVVFFLIVLASLRVGPGILRRVLPFSRELKGIWAERRALAKRYDSYQWRKLFGWGLGWLAYLLVSGSARNLPLFLATACLLAGGLGLVCWLRVSKGLATQAAAGRASA